MGKRGEVGGRERKRGIGEKYYIRTALEVEGRGWVMGNWDWSMEHACSASPAWFLVFRFLSSPRYKVLNLKYPKLTY